MLAKVNAHLFLRKKCTDEQRNEFLACTRTLCKELGEAIDALAHGIQLKQADPR